MQINDAVNTVPTSVLRRGYSLRPSAVKWVVPLVVEIIASVQKASTYFSPRLNRPAFVGSPFLSDGAKQV